MPPRAPFQTVINYGRVSLEARTHGRSARLKGASWVGRGWRGVTLGTPECKGGSPGRRNIAYYRDRLGGPHYNVVLVATFSRCGSPRPFAFLFLSLWSGAASCRGGRAGPGCLRPGAHPTSRQGVISDFLSPLPAASTSPEEGSKKAGCSALPRSAASCS